MEIVVDAMGSEHDHPGPDVAGAVQAAREFGDHIILVGDQAKIDAELASQTTTAWRWKWCPVATMERRAEIWISETPLRQPPPFRCSPGPGRASEAASGEAPVSAQAASAS